MEYSGSRTSGHRMSFGLLLLLAVVTGALGSGHSHRKLLQSVVPITVPAPASPSPTPAKRHPPPPAEILPGPSQILPPPPPPPTLDPNPPESSIPGADPPSFDSVTRPPPPPTPELSPPPTTTGAAVAPGTRTWNDPEKAGVVIAVIAGMLQVAVVGFLLVKRRQMLAAVDYEDFGDELSDHHSDQASHNYRRHPEHSA